MLGKCISVLGVTVCGNGGCGSLENLPYICMSLVFRHCHFSADISPLLPPGAFIARVCKDQFCTLLVQCACDSLSEAVCCSYSIMVMILCSVPFSLNLDNQSSLVSKCFTDLQAWRFNSSKTEVILLG